MHARHVRDYTLMLHAASFQTSQLPSTPQTLEVITHYSMELAKHVYHYCIHSYATYVCSYMYLAVR